MDVQQTPAQTARLPQDIDCVITSPPYMNALDYRRDDRLRLWFLGETCTDARDRAFGTVSDFSNLIGSVATRLARHVRPGGYCVLRSRRQDTPRRPSLPLSNPPRHLCKRRLRLRSWRRSSPTLFPTSVALGEMRPASQRSIFWCFGELPVRRNIPSSAAFVGKTFSRFPNHVIRETVGKGATGRVFRAHDPNTESSLAFKVVPVTNLPRVWCRTRRIPERSQGTKHRSAPLCRSLDLDVFGCDEIETTTPCIVFVREYIRGTSLAKLLRDRSQDVGVSLVETFLRTTFELLYELNERHIIHGDLDAGNIIVEDPQFNVYGQARFRVTDFGVKDIGEELDGAIDYLALPGRILDDMLQAVSYPDATPRDRYVFNVLRLEFCERPPGCGEISPQHPRNATRRQPRETEPSLDRGGTEDQIPASKTSITVRSQRVEQIGSH